MLGKLFSRLRRVPLNFFSEKKTPKIQEYFDLQTHQTEIKDTRFLYDLHIDENKTLTLGRNLSDEAFLNKFGLHMEEVERKTAYYKVLH